MCVQAVFETSRSVDGVAASQQGQASLASWGVNYTWPDSQLLIGAGEKGRESALFVCNRDAARQRGLGVCIGDLHLERRIQDLAERALVEFEIAHQDIVVFARGEDGQRVLPVSQRAGRKRQCVNKRRFHKKKFADAFAIQLDVPIQFYVTLMDEQSGFGSTAVGGEVNVRTQRRQVAKMLR